MLKIKDNVDLKELEKFGFMYYEYINNNVYLKTSKDDWSESTTQIDIKNRTIATFPEEYSYTVVADIIYDLIKADLVEKVENEGNK